MTEYDFAVTYHVTTVVEESFELLELLKKDLPEDKYNSAATHIAAIIASAHHGVHRLQDENNRLKRTFNKKIMTMSSSDEDD